MQQNFNAKMASLKPEYQQKLALEQIEELAKEIFPSDLLPSRIDKIRFFALSHSNPVKCRISADTFIKLWGSPSIEHYSVANIMCVIQVFETLTFFDFSRTFPTIDNPVKEWAETLIEVESLTSTINPRVDEITQRLIRKYQTNQRIALPGRNN